MDRETRRKLLDLCRVSTEEEDPAARTIETATSAQATEAVCSTVVQITAAIAQVEFVRL
jgi:hypothetical protein